MTRWRALRPGVWLLLVLAFTGAQAGAAGRQDTPAASATALEQIPGPQAIAIPPRPFAAYGALLAAAMLGALYLYRGRPFIVYWMVSWLLVAGAMALMSRTYADPRFNDVMLGIAALLSVWSGGLLVLAARAFPTAPLRWSAPLRIAAATAVWFTMAPLVLSPRVVLTTGPAASAVLLMWAAVRYLQLARRTRYLGALMVGAGIVLVAVSNGVAAILVARLAGDGSSFNHLLVFNVVANTFVALGMHLIVFEDMTDELRRTNRELASANEEVRRLAITDPLTGCYNRHFFDEIERRELQRHRRYQSPLSVVFVDVDRFKQLNDSLGHDTGDAALRAIGALLRAHVRETDYVIRWGGDEFLLLLTCTATQAEWKARELKAAFQTDAGTENLPGDVGLSMGIAEVTGGTSSLSGAIRLADERMYHDKFTSRLAPSVH